MKKLIPALCLLLVSVVLMGTSTFAWFSMNKTVSATGMQVKATSAASLVIDETTAGLLANRKITLELTANTDAIAPSTLNWSTYTTTGLGYVTNPTEIDPGTGMKKAGGQDLTLQDVSLDPASGKYYIDYTVYVAAAGGAMDAALDVQLSMVTNVTDTLRKAFTVAFYVDSVSAENHKGSLRFDQIGGSHKVTLVTKSTGSIPEATGSTGIKVIMRVYLDGAYTEGNNIANVNNGTVNTSSVTFGAIFTADES